MSISKNDVNDVGVFKDNVDFMLLVSVDHANPNGDPARENMPKAPEVYDLCRVPKVDAR